MCGITGTLCLAEPGQSAALGSVAAEMAATLIHRGPDADGVWTDGVRIALGHRRLSILDLSPLGRNPMLWDGERLAITFNGEIYNFRELRADLESRGYRFRSQTDTEVILAAYDAWGTECVQRFVGMFAFALWDARQRRLWLVRDRLGKKPLYYAQRAGRLTFASELKAFFRDPTFPTDVDPSAVQLYLRYGYVPAPYTILKAVRKLEPAHYLLAENGQKSIVRYWDPLDFTGAPPRTDADAEAELESLLHRAVRQREIADVPLGAFLSGGIDSSLIVALMQEHVSAAVRTFTIRFDNPQFNEADHAAAVARHLGTEHHEQTCSEQDMLDVVDRLPDMFDEPFGDSSAIPTFLVSRFAREQVTVALSGDGGDELFFGYPRYQFHVAAGWALKLPRPMQKAAAWGAAQMPTPRLRRIADVMGDPGVDPYGRLVGWMPWDEIEAITGGRDAEAPAYAAMLRRIGRVPVPMQPSLLDLVSYLPDDILTKVDRASMAASLEVRAPLLDHRVVEFALSLSDRQRRRGRMTKWLLRKLLYKRVPRALVDRPKMGFGVPLEDWFRGPIRARMNDHCASDDLSAIGLDSQPVRRLWNGFLAGRRPRPDLLWQALMLMAWSRRFIRSRVAA
jgi:asparagine synthase (glutamine-hydrolysing)